MYHYVKFFVRCIFAVAIFIVHMHAVQKESRIILDPLVQKFIDSLPVGTPLYTLAPKDARQVLNKLQAGPIKKAPADIQDVKIPGGVKGREISIRIIRPQGAREKIPVIIYMHGGGWVLGNRQTHDRLVRALADGVHAAVVFVDYPNAPESQYPGAHEQGYAAAEWVFEHGNKLNVDTTRMAIAGDSVGGLMATAIAMMAQERGQFRFIFQALMYPVTDGTHFDTASYKQFATGYYLELKGMQWFWDNYVPDKSKRTDYLVSPLRAPVEKLKKLPPAYIMVNEVDVLRDEGEAYAHKLMQAGVPVVAVRYLGLTHDSLLLDALSGSPVVKAVLQQVIDQLRNAFAKK